MGIFGGNRNVPSSDNGQVGTDGRGGFVSVDSGVTTASGGDPVDNLINLAGQLADQDEASGR